MRLFRAAVYAAGRATVAAAKATVNAAYSPTMQGKVAQGASELSNALFSQSNAYSPYTADNAARRAQFQAKEQSHAHGQ